MHNSKPQVALFFGGDSVNRDLSEATGWWVCQYLPRARFRVTPVRVTADGRWQVPRGSLPAQGSVRPVLRELFAAVPPVPAQQGVERLLARQPDVFLTLLRGRGGDDGALHGLGSMLGLPVAGPTQTACHHTADKAVCAERLADIVSAPLARRYTAADEWLVDDIRASFTPPLFVKPTAAEGSAGVAEVTTYDDLLPAMHQALAHGPALVQPRSAGQEVSVSVFRGPRGEAFVLPPTTIVPRRAHYFDSLAKRHGGRVTLLPSRLEKNVLLDEVEDIARDVFEELGGEGLLTLDLTIGPRTELLEVNSVPTLTPLTPLVHQLKAGGVHPAQLFSALLSRALERGPR